MSESLSSEDLELLLREVQALEEENYVLSEAYAAVEASTTSQKGQGEGDAATPTAGIKVWDQTLGHKTNDFALHSYHFENDSRVSYNDCACY